MGTTENNALSMAPLAPLPPLVATAGAVPGEAEWRPRSAAVAFGTRPPSPRARFRERKLSWAVDVVVAEEALAERTGAGVERVRAVY